MSSTSTSSAHWADRAAAAFPVSAGPAYRTPDALRDLHASRPTQGSAAASCQGFAYVTTDPTVPRTTTTPDERDRSRGARRALRPGAPGRVARARGSLPDLSAPAAREAALAEYHEGVYSGTSRHTMTFKWRTITRIFADWGTDLYPPSVGKVHLLGATLKAGGYRSAAGYVSLYRTHCARAGHGFGPELAVAARDAARSCARGLGGPVRATPLPLEQLHRLTGGRAPWVAGGPCSPRNAVVTGTWWLLREIELSTLPAHLVEVSKGTDGLPVVSLTLPASKTDQAARGAARCHRCRCESVSAPFSCPAHAVLDQMAFLRRQFPQRWPQGRPDQLLPLFPGLGGDTVRSRRW